MPEVFITSQELINLLKVSSVELIDIQKILDSINNDKWKLVEGKDYKIVSKNTGLREYTLSGAYKITCYLKISKKRDVVDVVKKWFFGKHKNIRIAFVIMKILDNCSSLVKSIGQFFLSQADVIVILGTRSDYLVKMVKYVQSTQFALIKGQDYDNFIDGGGIHYSLEGIHKLTKVFQEKMSEKHRREWCADIGEVITPQVNEIVAQILNRDQEIQAAMDRVKKRDKKTCQVSEEKVDSINKLNLAAHHLYSRSEYPHLADVDSNLITLTTRIHEQFHNEYMGGNTKPCTVDDLIDFVQRYYPTNTKVVIWLLKQKLTLGNQQPLNKRERHVLYLPASRFK